MWGKLYYYQHLLLRHLVIVFLSFQLITIVLSIYLLNVSLILVSTMINYYLIKKYNKGLDVYLFILAIKIWLMSTIFKDPLRPYFYGLLFLFIFSCFNLNCGLLYLFSFTLFLLLFYRNRFNLEYYDLMFYISFLQILFRFSCIVIDNWDEEIWGMFSHLKHLVETSIKVTGSSSGGGGANFNNIPPHRSFSKLADEKQLETCMSTFVDKHRKYTYTRVLNNEILKAHFAYEAHQELSLTKPLPINSWLDKIAPVIFHCQKPSLLTPQQNGQLFELLSFGSLMNNNCSYDSISNIEEPFSLKTLKETSRPLHLGTFSQLLEPSKIAVNNRILPFIVQNGTIQFSNGYIHPIEMEGKLIIFGTGGADSRYFSNIYQISMNSDFIEKCKPQFTYCQSTNSYSISYIISSKDWQASVEKVIKKP